jgi:hypothetical protein
MIPILVGMSLPWLLVGTGCWLVYQLARQNGRMLLRLEGLEEQVGLLRGLLELESNAPKNLPVGSTAPDFVLSDLDGRPPKCLLCIASTPSGAAFLTSPFSLHNSPSPFFSNNFWRFLAHTAHYCLKQHSNGEAGTA